MHHVSRKILFALFLAFFLLAAPALVLYTAGYRYNTTNGRIMRTGVLAVSSSPRGAAINFDGEDTGRTTPYVFSRTMPGEYTVTLSRAGYHTYSDTITVESGKTTYVSDIALFAAGAPTLRTAEEGAALFPSAYGDIVLIVRSAEVWEYDVKSERYTLLSNAQDGSWKDAARLRYNLDYDATAAETQTVGNLLLVQGESATEVRKADAPEMLVAILPRTTYTVPQVDGDMAVVTTANGQLYLIDLSSTDPILLSTRATAFDWKPDNGVLAWTDGIEVNVYNAATRVSTFVTRQSEPLVDVALHENGRTVFAATTKTVQSLAIGTATTHTTTLATMELIEQCWTFGDALFIIGSIDGVRGVYELGLR